MILPNAPPNAPNAPNAPNLCVVACVALTIPNNFVALVPRGDGMLTFPSAELQGGEGLKAAACRAAYEDLSVNVKPCDLRATTFTSVFKENTTVVFTLYELTKWDNKILAKNSPMGDFAWVNPFKFNPSRIEESDRILLANLAKVRHSRKDRFNDYNDLNNFDLYNKANKANSPYPGPYPPFIY